VDAVGISVNAALTSVITVRIDANRVAPQWALSDLRSSQR